MKTRYYVGDPNIPWWVEELAHQGLITTIRESAAITFILVFKTCRSDAGEHYLYDGDYLELNEETGAVTIGYDEWDKALSSEFQKVNWNKFVDTLKKTAQDKKQKEENEANYYSNYWA